MLEYIFYMFNFKILNTLRLKSILYDIGIYISLHDISSERQLKPPHPPSTMP